MRIRVWVDSWQVQSWRRRSSTRRNTTAVCLTMLVPVPGSATMTQIHHANGWEDDSSESRFVGYVVDLDVAQRPPARATTPLSSPG
jgi:hypothetical protein